MSNHDREDSRPSDRDAALERAWREASTEQPPSHLDAALIAAARKSVPGRAEQLSKPLGRMQSRYRITPTWLPLAAAAGITGMAFILVQMLPHESNFAPTMQRKESAPVPASADPQLKPQPQLQPRSSSTREATGIGQAPRADEPVDPRDLIAVPDRAPAQRVVPAPPASPAPPATKAAAAASDPVPTAETAVSNTAPRAEAAERNTTPRADTGATLGELGTDRQKAAGSEMTGRAATTATAAPSLPARERTLGDAAPLDAAAWVARIVTLHESGDFTAAEQALRAFRASDPDADSYLPDSLRNWARTVE